MGTPAFILFPSDTLWRVCKDSAGESVSVDVPVSADYVSDDVASLLLATVQKLGYSGQPVVLAIASSWCLAAAVSNVDLPKKDRKALLFRLEEKLPLAAEAVVADFISLEGAESGLAEGALGVCVRIETLRPIVEALEKAGVAVGSISPSALLCVQHILEDQSFPPSIVLCSSRDSLRVEVNVLVIAGTKPARWALLPPLIADIKQHLALLSADGVSTERVTSCDVDAGIISALGDAAGVDIVCRDDSSEVLAARFAALVAQGRRRPLIDFRRGPLAVRDPLLAIRKPLNFLLGSALALFLICAGVMLLRAQDYDRIRQAADQRMVDAFRDKFPGWTVPSNVRAVVESEHQKAAARSGDSLPSDSTRSALQTFRDVLANLPAEKTFTLGRMTILDSSFEIEGRLRSYEDADALAAAARKAGFDVPAPQARKEGDGLWSFTLRGTLPAKPVIANGASKE